MIKKYNQFIKESNIDIDSICKKYDIINYTINQDLTIDVDVTNFRFSVDLSNKGLNEIPLKFGKVTGNFYCGYNNLTNLEGSPKEVGSIFYCQNNKLTTLKGAPDKIESGFNCSYNNLINFKYLPLANNYIFFGNPIYEFLKYFDNYNDKKNLGLYLRLFEDIVQFPYLDDLEFEELAKCLKQKLPENWRDSVTSYKMLSQL